MIEVGDIVFEIYKSTGITHGEFEVINKTDTEIEFKNKNTKDVFICSAPYFEKIIKNQAIFEYKIIKNKWRKHIERMKSA